jgi:hypothetical protein
VLRHADAEHRHQHHAQRREGDEHLHHLRQKPVNSWPASRFFTTTGFAVRGSIAEKDTGASSADTTQVMISASRNSTPGSGSLLPTRSIQSSIRAIRGLAVA